SGGIAMMVIAAGILAYDFYREIRHRQAQAMPEAAPTAAPHIRWRASLALALLAWGTLYPGAHFVTPLAENVALFDTRDQLFTTGESEDAKAAARKAEPLNVQAKEGLSLGLAITVRYQVDPKHLDYIQANLPQPLEKEIVPAVVATAWRELVPAYTVREVFSTKREEVRQRASEMIRKRLAADGIVVKE